MNIDHIRQQLPALQQQLYFNTGTCGPLPVSVTSCMKEALDKQLQNGRADLRHFDLIIRWKKEIKEMLASIINSTPEEISLTSSTTEGLNVVINGMDWRYGDEVITTNAEHPTGYGPLFNLKSKGIKIHFLDVLNGYESVERQLQSLISSRTRLVSISHTIYCTGDRLPVKELIDTSHRHNIPVLLDGAQSFGAISLDMQELQCDFYAAPGQKWICGPEGTGFLYVSNRGRQYLQPVFTSYTAIKKIDLYDHMEYETDGRAFESCTIQPVSLAGMHEALHWIQSAGLKEKEERNKNISSYAWDLFKDNPRLTIINHHRADNLISFHAEGISSAEVSIRLLKYGVVVRPVPITDAVRVSIGFYNTEEEINKLDHYLRLL